MPSWVTWLLVGLLAWAVLSVLAGLVVGRFIWLGTGDEAPAPTRDPDGPPRRPRWDWAEDRRRILVVDDDSGLRMLLRTTLPAGEFAVEEAESAESAAELHRFFRPDVVILDVSLPGADGLSFSRELKRGPDAPRVILLTGTDLGEDEYRAAGAEAILRKPFSPIELLTLVDRVDGQGGLTESAAAGTEQLLVYARDLSHVVERERRQRRLLEQAYRQTVTALVDALEAKDPLTGLHGRRVQRYGLELAAGVDDTLAADPSLEYGFLLHDVGKIGIPETILGKTGPLDRAERRLMQRHPLLGAEILRDIPLLEGQGLDVVRSHHERWDGSGYPDGLAGEEIPIGARIFALADTLDAMTSDRPYRRRLSWDAAIDEILVNSGSQFDPRVVAAFAAREQRLRRIAHQLSERAA